MQLQLVAFLEQQIWQTASQHLLPITNVEEPHSLTRRTSAFGNATGRKFQNKMLTFYCRVGLPSAARNGSRTILRPELHASVPSEGWWRRGELNPRPWPSCQPRLHA